MQQTCPMHSYMIAGSKPGIIRMNISITTRFKVTTTYLHLQAVTVTGHTQRRNTSVMCNEGHITTSQLYTVDQVVVYCIN